MPDACRVRAGCWVQGVRDVWGAVVRGVRDVWGVRRVVCVPAVQENGERGLRLLLIMIVPGACG